MKTIEKLRVPQNLTSLAYEKIKRYVLQGDLEDDTHLTEEFLSKQLGISKSPVREALNSLQAEGLVRIEPRRGTYLRQFSVKEVRDLYDLREVLEVFAVSTARITPELVNELMASVERMRRYLKAKDRAGHIEEDVYFHSAISSATGNAELCRVLRNVQNQIWLCRCKTYNLSASTAIEAHQSVLEALRNGNHKKAEAAMRNHIAHVRAQLIRFLES